MLVRILFIISLSLMALGVFGCGEASYSTIERDYSYTEKEPAVSIDLLAARLGLKVAERNGTHVTLKSSSCTVLIFTHTGSRFFVNGEPKGHVGEISEMGGKIYVSESLVGKIRTAMGSASAYRPELGKKLSGTVVIDAGHGGKDPGAISTLGFYEKNVNLRVARKVAYILRQRGLRVVMTRDSDRFVELETRAKISNDQRANLFVSIHADSCMERSLKGYTVYIARVASSKSRYAARRISAEMGKINSNGHGVKRGDYRVLVKNKRPAVLVEIGYISNSGEASLIARDSYQNRIARAISEGICDAIVRI